MAAHAHDVVVKEHSDPSTGFLPGKRHTFQGSIKGTLKGLCFAAKDNMDVLGAVTGAGNPYWSKLRSQAEYHAPIVERLLAGGANLAGKTIQEELAFSVIGNNPHFPTLENPVSSGHFVGGSSSGSAAVVANRQVDFALGTDTAGSVRVPASNCGLCGIRPSHGVLSAEGIVPLAPSFDVPGWMAANAGVLARVGNVLLADLPEMELGTGALINPAWASLPKDVATLYQKALARLPLDRLRMRLDFPNWQWSLDEAAEAFRVLQAKEVWALFGEWAMKTQSHELSQDIKDRVVAGRMLGSRDLSAARLLRSRVCHDLNAALDESGLLVMPTVARPPVSLVACTEQLAAYRRSIIRLTCLTSLTGLPEVTIPLIKSKGFHWGLSVIGPRRSDRSLLSLAEKFACGRDVDNRLV
ncbi:MAG: amidase family protein [Pseudomonadota bacterium]